LELTKTITLSASPINEGNSVFYAGEFIAYAVRFYVKKDGKATAQLVFAPYPAPNNARIISNDSYTSIVTFHGSNYVNLYYFQMLMCGLGYMKNLTGVNLVDVTPAPVTVAPIPVEQPVTPSGAPMGTWARFLDVAYNELGYHEIGINETKYHPRKDTYGYEWCAYFVAWVAKEAGVGTVPTWAGGAGEITRYYEKIVDSC
jgi:hypothetical protein